MEQELDYSFIENSIRETLIDFLQGCLNLKQIDYSWIKENFSQELAKELSSEVISLDETISYKEFEFIIFKYDNGFDFEKLNKIKHYI